MILGFYSLTAALFACFPIMAGAVSSSEDYVVSHQVLDFGGGHSASADYANVGSISAIGSSAASEDYVGHGGFIGQIHDAPIVVIGSASEVTRTDGIIHGSVYPNALDTSLWFEFGPAGDLNQTVPLPDLDGDAVAETVSTILSSLVPGRDYQYRLVASNADGTVQSAVQDFSAVVNLAPVADEITLERLRDLSVKILVSELLGRATDPENDPIGFGTAASVSANGGQIFVSGGWVLYQPPPGYHGDDTFTYTIADSFGAEATGTVQVVIRGRDEAPTLNVRSIEQIPGSGGHVRVRFAGVPGRTYEIQATEDLSEPWETILTATADSSGLYGYIDEDAGDYSQRFYRAVRQ